MTRKPIVGLNCRRWSAVMASARPRWAIWPILSAATRAAAAPVPPTSCWGFICLKRARAWSADRSQTGRSRPFGIQPVLGVLPEWRGRTFGLPGYGVGHPHRPQTRRRRRHPHSSARPCTTGSTEWPSRRFRELRRAADRYRGRSPGSTSTGGATGETAIPHRKGGSGGFYALLDRLLYKDPDRPEQRLAGFLQAGIGDHRVNRFGSYLGAGLTLTGPFEARSGD